MSTIDAAPHRVGVLGGGRMGAGIAHAFLLAGSRVSVIERDAASADGARTRVADSIRRSVQRDPDLDEDELLGRLSTGDDPAMFSTAAACRFSIIAWTSASRLASSFSNASTSGVRFTSPISGSSFGSTELANTP